MTKWMKEYTEQHQRMDKYYIYVIDRYNRKWFLCTNGRFSKYQSKKRIFTALYKAADTKTKLAKQNNISEKNMRVEEWLAPPKYSTHIGYQRTKPSRSTRQFIKDGKNFYKTTQSSNRYQRRISTL